jgi:hypothetical protein
MQVYTTHGYKIEFKYGGGGYKRPKIKNASKRVKQLA